MFRKISSTALWVAIFFVLVAVQVYSALGQSNELVGSWKTGSVGSVQYQDQVTRATKSGRSSLFTYKFLANGNYEFIGYMEMNMYNCNTTLFNQITGKYVVDGSTVNLSPTKDLWRSGNSCAASGNKQQNKVPVKKVLEFRTKTDEYGADLLCLTDGQSETCYKREK